MERRYLRDRLVMPVDDPGSVLRVLAERLKQNAVVSLTVRGWARRPVKGVHNQMVTRPVGLGKVISCPSTNTLSRVMVPGITVISTGSDLVSVNDSCFPVVKHSVSSLKWDSGR